MLATVKGGTGGGRKRALKPKPTAPWPCLCIVGTATRRTGSDEYGLDFEHVTLFQTNPPHLARCPRCRTRRP